MRASIRLYKAQTVRDTARAKGSEYLSRAHILDSGILHMLELWHVLITAQALHLIAGYMYGKVCTAV